MFQYFYGGRMNDPKPFFGFCTILWEDDGLDTPNLDTPQTHLIVVMSELRTADPHACYPLAHHSINESL